MPAYNAESFIGTAIKSVISQTLEDWEMIVVEDCSIDSTQQIVGDLIQGDGRIKMVRNRCNLGAARSRNRAFELCRGDFVALLDADDLWQPDKLERQVRTAQRMGAEIVYCSYSLIDESGERVAADFIVPETTDFDRFLSQSVISCSTALFKRSLIDEYQMPTDVYHEDLAFWLMLLQRGKCAIGITDVLASYRRIGGSRSSNKVKSALNRWKLFRRYFDLGFERSARAFIRYGQLAIGKYCFDRSSREGVDHAVSEDTELGCSR